MREEGSSISSLDSLHILMYIKMKKQNSQNLLILQVSFVSEKTFSLPSLEKKKRKSSQILRFVRRQLRPILQSY